MPVLYETPNLILFGELQQVRNESDKFFSIIKGDAIFDRPIDARHRVLFYIGHLDGFDSILFGRELTDASPDAEFDRLFQAGIDPDAGSLPQDKPSDWPSLEQVLAYASRCRRRVNDAFAHAGPHTVQMAVEHRLMHLETLAYMFHNFGYDRKQRAFHQEIVTSGEIPANSWIRIPAGKATLGQSPDAFGWDNEFGAWTAAVPPFQIQRNSVTNGEYLRFVQAGAPLPHFWAERNGKLFWRGMFEDIPLPLDWPVYVTQQQASAYAEWNRAALPTEEQFHRAAYGTPTGAERLYPWGSESPAREFGNFDSNRWDPEPVWKNPGESAFGVTQLVGNGWQWTNTPFGPFEGFQPRPAYPGYSLNFFDGEHFVIKGGSPRTGARLLRRSFRNWFRRDYRYVYATFRCVRED